MKSSLRLFVFSFLGALMMMTVSSTPSHAQPALPAAEGLLVSPAVPVADRPVRVYVSERAASGQVRFVITSEATGEVVAEQDGAELEHGFGIEVTLPETGYYVATAGTNGASEAQWKLRFPVVYRDFHFGIWPDLQPEEHGLRFLAADVIVPGADKNPELVAAWRARGSKVLGATFTGGRQIKADDSEEVNIERLVSAWTRSFAEGCDGIWIDEFGAYPTEGGMRKVRIFNAALKQFREANPDALIYVAVAGDPAPELAAGIKAADAVAQLETYESWLTAAFATHRYYEYLDTRIDVARRTDLIQEINRSNAAVILMGYDGLHGGTGRAQLEEAVRYSRLKAPAMPGMAFYASRRTWEWLRDTEIRSFINDLMERYFIQPVLEVNSFWLERQTPVAGQPVEVTVRVHNIGGMQARNVNVHLYASPVGLNERHEVGTVTLDKVGVGQIDVADKSLSEATDYRFEEIGGEQVPIFNAYGTVSQDRESAKFAWTPEAGGAYVLHAVIEASEGITLIKGVLSRDVVVAAPSRE